MRMNKNILFDKIKDIINKYNIFNSEEYDLFIDLISKIVFNCPQKYCKIKGKYSDWEKNIPHEKSLFYCDDFHGLPIGNISSQIFSNIYLNDFDHYVVEVLGFKYYGRYCDDFYILSTDKEKILNAIPLIETYLSNIDIILHPKKRYIQCINKGVKFIGSVIRDNRTYISNRTVYRCYDFIYKTFKYAKTHYLTYDDLEYFTNSFNSYLGFMKHHKSYNIRKEIFKYKYLQPLLNFVYPNKNFTKIRIYRNYTKRKNKGKWKII